MCGITGFSGKRPVDMTKIRWLLRENESRGTDAAGVYAGGVLFKRAVRAKELLKLEGVNSTLKGQRTLQAHTRAKTCGANIDQNAHPFLAGDPKDPWYCVGSHNGWIDVDLELHKKELGLVGKMEVDSQLIFEAIAKHKTFEILPRLSGVIACAFMLPNQDPNVLFLYKNGPGRSLHIGEASDGLYYSSEAEPLELIGCDQVWPLEAHKVYSIKYGEIIDVVDLAAPVAELGPNATRHTWRNGLSNDQRKKLDLPTLQLPAKSSTMGFKQAASGRGKRFESPLETEKYISSFKGDTDKLLAMITQCKNDLATMNINPVTSYVLTDAWKVDDNNCGLLMIKLIDNVKKLPLIAWGVFAEENIEIAGITSISGCALIKFPYAYCGRDIKLLLYDPTDTLEPRYVTIKAEAASVQEVTLSIPFRKETDGEVPSNTLELFTEDAGDKRGTTVRPLHVSSTNNPGVHAPNTGAHKDVVRGEQSKQLRGSRKKGSNNEQALEQTKLDKRAGTAAEDPSKKHNGQHPTGNERQLGLSLNSSREQTIKHVCKGFYKPKDEKEFDGRLASGEAYHLRLIYQHKFSGLVFVDKLIKVAVMMQMYDAEKNKGYSYNLRTYIRDILIADWVNFVTDKVLAHGYFDYRTLLPDNLLDKKSPTEVLENIKKILDDNKTTSYLPVEENRLNPTEYQKYQKVRLTFKDSKMVIIKNEDKFLMQQIERHKECVDNLLNNVRNALASGEPVTQNQMGYKESLTKVREFLKEESSDLGDYYKLVKNRAEKKEKETSK